MELENTSILHTSPSLEHQQGDKRSLLVTAAVQTKLKQRKIILFLQQKDNYYHHTWTGFLAHMKTRYAKRVIFGAYENEICEESDFWCI
jgi:hypothetical protein